MNGLRRKKILITAGPTREYFDPVRYLTNASSGEMGFALAEELARRGARVTVVHGPTHLKAPRTVKARAVTSALEMHRAVQKEISGAHAFVATAAVSDWRFKKSYSQKQKKGARSVNIQLVANPDILYEVSRMKKRPLLIGFALETKNVVPSMKKKMRRKNLDLIIGNTPASFSTALIKPLWLERVGQVKRWPSMTKKALARKMTRWLDGQLS